MKKELLENEKLLSHNKLKAKNEKEIKFHESNFKTSNDKINKKHERLNYYYNKTFNEKLDSIEKEYNNIVSKLEYNKKKILIKIYY